MGRHRLAGRQQLHELGLCTGRHRRRRRATVQAARRGHPLGVGWAHRGQLGADAEIGTPAAEAASSDKPFRFTLADTTRAAKKLSWSTGKAAWTFGTSFLLLVVPLIIQLHREEQMMAMEQEQLGVLNSGGAAEPATSK